MVLADGKHFRAGAKRLRRVALFFLDDSTRYGLEVVVGTAESAPLFLTVGHGDVDDLLTDAVGHGDVDGGPAKGTSCRRALIPREYVGAEGVGGCVPLVLAIYVLAVPNLHDENP